MRYENCTVDQYILWKAAILLTKENNFAMVSVPGNIGNLTVQGEGTMKGRYIYID